MSDTDEIRADESKNDPVDDGADGLDLAPSESPTLELDPMEIPLHSM